MKQVQKSKKAESGGSISIATSTTSGLDVLPNSVVTVQPKQNVQVQLDTSTCRAFIETLRREQFGIGLKLTPETSSIFLAQQKRLERALKRLSDELYSESTHFVLELLQNADDNNYASNIIPRGEFLLSNSAVVFFNNEMGFTKDNIRALCDVGASTKASSHHKTTNNREERASLIGKKGIGFKSVFKVSNMPQVHSNGFHIGFHARSKNGFGYILPHWLEPKDTEWIIDPRPFGTTFVLPFQNHEDKHKESLKQLFDDVQPNVLLFLKQLKEIVLEDKLSRPTRRLHIRLEKKKLFKSDGADDDDDGEEEEEENTLVTLYANDMPEFWLMKSKMIQVPSFSFDGIQRAQTTRLSLAFPIQKMDDVSMSTPLQVQSASLQSVFCYLPLRSYGLRFVIQADFDVPSSREAISSGSAWNEWLISHVPTLFVDALLLFHSQKRSLLEFFAFFPKEKEVQSPFRIVCQEISRLLQKRPCLPVVEEDAALVLVSPHQVLDITRLVHLVRQEIEQTKSGNESKYDESEVTRRVEQLLTQVLPSALIKQVFNKQFLQVEFGCRLPTSVKRSLRIETWTSNHLLKLLTHPLMINHLADNHTKRVQLLLWAVQLGIQERPNGHEMSLFIHELRLIRLFPVKKFLNKNTTKSRLVSTEDCQNALFLSETSHDFSNTDHLRQVDDMLAVVQDGLFVLETDFA
jgi:hypothetical protein